MDNINLLTLCSFNMFGFRNGLSMLNHLCQSHLIIGVQEHWIREDNLDKLRLIHEDFNYYAASGMNSAVADSILRGRHYSSTGFLWHNSLNGAIVPIGSSADGRCVAIKLIFM